MLRDGDQVIGETSIIIEHVAGARLVPSLEARKLRARRSWRPGDVAADEPRRERPLSVAPVEEVLRRLTPQVLATMLRRYGDFGRCEDAVQESLIQAVASWSRSEGPEEPLGWLITVASRRFVDQARADSSRERREQAVLDATPRDALVAAPADAEPVRDNTLELLFLCCHAALAPPSQMALTLRRCAD